MNPHPEQATVRHGGNHTGGRDLVIGDLHGYFGTLEHALTELAFDAGRDRLFSVGDPRAAAAIGRYITDFRTPHDDGGAWTVLRHVEAHRRQTQAMREQAESVDVVVTHWPPTLHAVHPMYADVGTTESLLNRYFINDEEALVREMNARFWIPASPSWC